MALSLTTLLVGALKAGNPPSNMASDEACHTLGAAEDAIAILIAIDSDWHSV